MKTSSKNILISILFIVFLTTSTSELAAQTTCSGSVNKNYTLYSCQCSGGGCSCVANNQSESVSCSYNTPGGSSYCGACVHQGQTCSSNMSSCDISDISGFACGGSSTLQSNGCRECTANCTGKVCGESNGCSGTCPNTGRTDWAAWTCGSCNNPGGCGNVTLTQDCTRNNVCGDAQNMTQNCGNACNECGPTYGAWGACTAPGFSRDRTMNYNCQADGTDTEACRGTLYGTFFDASLVDSCTAIAAQPKIENVTVTATATVNHTTAYSTTTDVNGDYTRNQLRIPDTYDLTFTLGAGAEYIDSPPKLLCDGALDNLTLTTQGQTRQRRVGLWRIFGGWYQIEGGGVYGQDGISVLIPSTCSLPANEASCNSYDDAGTTKTPLIVASANNDPGIVYSGDGELSLGGGGVVPANAVVSENAYNAESGYQERIEGYAYFERQAAQYQTTNRTSWNGTGKPSGATNGLYQSTATGTLTMDGGISPTGTESITIFHDGNVSITSNVDVPVGAFLAIIATGDIDIQPGVTSLEGVYIADGNFQVLSTGDEATEQRFVGEGTFVGLAGVVLQRDRGVTNNSESSEYFIFRPDFVINAPFGLRLPQYSWKEVNP